MPSLSRQLNFTDLARELRRHYGAAAPVKAVKEKLQEGGEPLLHWVYTQRHQCAQEYRWEAIKTRKGFVYRETVTSQHYTAQPWPKAIPFYRTGTVYLGSSKTPTFVIYDGQVQHNVGIGWVIDHPATEEDFYLYPVVEK